MTSRKVAWLVGGLGAAVLVAAVAGVAVPDGLGEGARGRSGARGNPGAAADAARIAAAMPPRIPAPDSVKPLSPADLAALPRARVVRAVDGDTLQLAGGERIRLIGINTPESVDPRRPVQEYGKEAAEFARRLAEGRDVRLEYDVERQDKFGRTLAYVFLTDGTFVNAELVRLGFAQTYRYPPNVKYADLFNRLQREARERKRGLWASR